MGTAVAFAAVDEAAAEIGVHESGGNNRGVRVEQYQAAAGAHPGDAWCASFVYFCFLEAAGKLGQRNPCPRTPGALAMWHRAPASAQSQEPTPGSVFVIDHGKGQGHVGFVVSVGPDLIYTIEGNSNEAGSREGVMVLRRTRRRDSINVGYLLFEDAGPAAPVA